MFKNHAVLADIISNSENAGPIELNTRKTRARFYSNPGHDDESVSAFSTGNSFRDRLSFGDSLNPNQFSSNYPYGIPSSNQRQNNADDAEGVNFNYAEGLTPTRIVRLKQGLVQGQIVEAKMQHALPGVERYLGLPYAAAPVGGLRFMPPGTAPPWTGLRSANHLPPVCPQTPPPLTASSMGRNPSSSGGSGVSPGRYAQLKRLLPYLRNQSEDCLYLNIYAPLQEDTGPLYKYPVLVFIHGESYEWGSGNPYDGSVLAAYARVVVVTVNFRLGILGFMRPGINEHTVSNFALLDQIAALQWIKDNIERFGGDRGAVTVAGHGTGAACASLLMVSPVANGLFHRAILMSGSALSDWAMASNPLQSTMQVAQSLNCPLGERDEEMVACLRKKRLSEIMAIRVSAPKYSTPFGPVVDGQVVPNDPDLVMRKYNNLFSRYECLYGVTEQESYHLLSGHALLHGMAEADKDSALRFYFQSRFEYRPDLALASTVREYSSINHDIDASPLRSLATAHRDVLLDILSDARVIAPLVLTGHYHSRVNAQSYMYVFAHNSQYGPYADLEKSVHGEDLAYFFGAPVEYRGGPFITDYLPQEALLSEVVMTFFTNFVKTGNPNAPRKTSFLHMSPLDWREFDLEWPEYNSKNQSYLFLSVPPNIAHKYRVHYTKFWNQELPEALINGTSYTSGAGDFGSNRLSLNTPGGGALGRMIPESRDNRQEGGRGYANMNHRPGSPSRDYGTFRRYPHEYDQSMRTTTMDPFVAIKVLTGRAPGLMDGPPRSDDEIDDHIDHNDFEGNENMSEVGYQGASMTTSVIIAIGLTVLLINSLAIALFYYRKTKRARSSQSSGQLPPRTYSTSPPRATTIDFLEENSYGNPTVNRSNNQRTGFASILSTSQPSNGESKARKFFRNFLTRNSSNNDGASNGNGFFSSSASKSSSKRRSQSATVKPKTEKHSRVRDWIQQEIVHRCSPKERRKDSVNPTPIIQLKQSHLPKPNAKRGALTGSLKAPVNFVSANATAPNPTTSNPISATYTEKPNKVSVAIDATPSARDSVVLRQQPIEFTKKTRADVIIDEMSEDSSFSSFPSNELDDEQVENVDIISNQLL
ncbi:neuroligin-4, Y-linked-like [Ctenocephalides felis]|uniref:neuroligin-4, Y-linked-like n=1 Tax=Ctenocephalides felis TaxID=7515 RepID=UPI000E6E28A9|nr:neuroligin-4, Y-linked-like [Ctenocephalides felis]